MSRACYLWLDLLPFFSVHILSSEESRQILELLLSGYWAFESLTVRDYNDMICGICGVAPKLEIAQRYSNNVLELKNVEVSDQCGTCLYMWAQFEGWPLRGLAMLVLGTLSVSDGSLPGLSIRSRMKCIWMTSGWPWKPRPLSKPFSPLKFPSPEWMLLSLLPSFLLWWGAPLSSTPRRTRSSPQHHGPQVLTSTEK